MAIGRQPKAARDAAARAEPRSGTVVRSRSYLHEVWVELQKTTWPTPQEAWRLTTVVLGVIIIVAVFLGILDYVLSTLTNRLQLIK